MSLMQAASYSSVYQSIYSRRLSTPSLNEVDASSARNLALPARQCFTIISSNALNRWLRTLKVEQSNGLRREMVLELGCGFGGLSRWIVDQMNCQIVALDGCALAVAVAEQ